MSDFSALCEPIIEAAGRLGPGAIGDRVDDLLERMWALGPPPDGEAARLIKALRANRCFSDLLRVTDRLLSIGYDAPPVATFMAQALIEQDQLSVAEQTLKALLQDPADGAATSEAHGLLGRLYKQRFVATAPHDRRRAGIYLGAAVAQHAAAYESDPIWHGSNIVALTWRAEQESLAVDGFEAARAAHVLLDKARAEKERERTSLRTPSPWVDAAMAQALMAQGDWDQAASCYAAYAQAVFRAKDAFMLMGDYRQLREIWQIRHDDDPSRSVILAQLAGMIAALPGGHLTETGSSLRALADRLDDVASRDDPVSRQSQHEEQREALIDGNALMPRNLLRQLDENSRFVCQIVDCRMHKMNRLSGGTGFLVNDGMFRNRARGVVLATNAHVLSESGAGKSVAAAEAQVIFHNWNGEDRSREFTVGEILWSSPPEAHDLCLAEISELPGDTRSIPISKQPSHYEVPTPSLDQKIGRAYLIGHPKGRDLEYSFETPGVIDHELHKGPNGVRRVHYRSPTEAGSSGSPVFDGETAEVIGIHRAAVHQPIDGSPKAFSADDYFANEGTGLHAAARQAREERS